MNEDGNIVLITCSHENFVLDARNFFNLNFISENEFLKNLDLDCKVFRTHLSTYVNINNLDKQEMKKLTNEDLDNDKIKEFKEYAFKKYGQYASVPISMFVLSKLK